MDLSLVNQYQWFCVSKRLVALCLFTSILASCAGTQSSSPTKTSAKINASEEIESKIHQDITAQEYFNSIKSLPTKQTLVGMVKASELFLQEKDDLKALWLANQAYPLITNESQLYRLNLIKASALSHLAYDELALEQLTKADTFSKVSGKDHTYLYYQTLSHIQQNKQQTIESAHSSLVAFTLNPNASNEDIFQLWQQLSQLTQWQITQLSQLNPPYFKGWQQLVSYANNFGSQPEKFNRYLTQWRRQFTNHPAQALIESLYVENIINKNIENIAILLPLSGKQSKAGKVAQEGILAAYQNDKSKNLHFIDAQSVDMSTLKESFIALNIDYVVGPLLKANVNNYVNQVDLDIPTLLLNVPNSPLSLEHVALSMRPDDEAKQAATILSRRKYQYPIVISHNGSVSKRIAKSFAQQWEITTGKVPEIIYFEQGKAMQANLKSSLDVNLSQLRIKELEYRIKQTLKTELRNRRDVDMIYLIGTPQETRLLKPFIDVNTSPFAKVIPVFASSRSHSAKNSANDSPDLKGLVFTEIPWLLDSKQQNKALAQLSHELWPQRSDSLQRIFAMGFDSLSLIDKLEEMKTSPFIRHFGQTGTLKLNKDNILSRSLLWGSYRKDKVLEIVVE